MPAPISTTHYVLRRTGRLIRRSPTKLEERSRGERAVRVYFETARTSPELSRRIECMKRFRKRSIIAPHLRELVAIHDLSARSLFEAPKLYHQTRDFQIQLA